MFDRDHLITDLESPANEGFRSLVYDDGTGKVIRRGSAVEGNPTIGIGWNCAALPLTPEQARVICGWAIDAMWAELVRAQPWVADLDEPRARALMNMAFNLGVPTLLTFSLMLEALRDGRWLDAKDQALDSEWAKQVPNRAKRIAETFATGVG